MEFDGRSLFGGTDHGADYFDPMNSILERYLWVVPYAPDTFDEILHLPMNRERNDVERRGAVDRVG